MKKIVYSIIVSFFTLGAFGQAAWIEPKNPDVTKPVRIYCDLSKVTASTADAMKSNPDGPYYIWTWKPVEARPDSLANGTGDRPWKSSNERLVMTKDADKGANVWYFECVPTEFYGVEATVVYQNGISFLVKPKDGGGYGDPDVKTEDFNLVVEPPSLDRGILYTVPKILLNNEITSIIYDNPLETKASMQNLADGDVYAHLLAVATDTVSGATVNLEPNKFFKVTDNPKLQMKKMTDGRFKITMIPNRFFAVPAGYVLTSIEVTVRRKVWNSAADQTDKKTKLEFGCQ
ncbi:MAG: hypothetical protein ACK5UI_08860 [Bacteroidota bacterium]